MKRNVGKLDKLVRLVSGICIIGASVYYQSWWGVVGFILACTALFYWCPVYAIMGVNSCDTVKNE